MAAIVKISPAEIVDKDPDEIRLPEAKRAQVLKMSSTYPGIKRNCAPLSVFRTPIRSTGLKPDGAAAILIEAYWSFGREMPE